jgi:hypothetical protein
MRIRTVGTRGTAGMACGTVAGPQYKTRTRTCDTRKRKPVVKTVPVTSLTSETAMQIPTQEEDFVRDVDKPGIPLRNPLVSLL